MGSCAQFSSALTVAFAEVVAVGEALTVGLAVGFTVGLAVALTVLLTVGVGVGVLVAASALLDEANKAMAIKRASFFTGAPT